MTEPIDQPPMGDLQRQLARIGALAEPLRRQLYGYVVEQPDAVSRDEAAAGTGIARHTAKFHLDRLVSDGLLQVEFRRPPGRTGPGAGRPAKHYRASADEVALSVPPRRYELAARILAAAVCRAGRDDVAVTEALRLQAREAGATLGAAASPGAPREAADHVLAEVGYRPRPGAEPGEVCLANCPFHALVADQPDLVCGLSFDLVEGVLGGLPGCGYRAVLDPAPGRCCVRLQAS